MASQPKADGYAGHLAWVTSVFGPLGVADIQMWTAAEHQTPDELNAFGGVYLGGGNTFELLRLLRASGIDRLLRYYALAGGAVYGGSAGAIVLGADIASCERDDTSTPGLTDLRGLDLLDGHDVWCHFESEQSLQVQAFCDVSGRPIYAVPERGGLCLDQGTVRSAGDEAVWLFRPSLPPRPLSPPA